jgi:hypothetical protein
LFDLILLIFFPSRRPKETSKRGRRSFAGDEVQLEPPLFGTRRVAEADVNWIISSSRTSASSSWSRRPPQQRRRTRPVAASVWSSTTW